MSSHLLTQAAPSRDLVGVSVHETTDQTVLFDALLASGLKIWLHTLGRGMTEQADPWRDVAVDPAVMQQICSKNT
jgi:hypothetical protein